MTMAPPDWFFIEIKDDETGEIYVAWACKGLCAIAMWKKGPGVLEIPDEDTTALLAKMKCTGCGASGVRMWRIYQTVAIAADPRCRACSEAEQNCKLEPPGDQIGWRIPAVPVDDTYWGYTSVPQAAVLAWKALPEVTP